MRKKKFDFNITQEKGDDECWMWKYFECLGRGWPATGRQHLQHLDDVVPQLRLPSSSSSSSSSSFVFLGVFFLFVGRLFSLYSSHSSPELSLSIFFRGRAFLPFFFSSILLGSSLGSSFSKSSMAMWSSSSYRLWLSLSLRIALGSILTS